MIYETEIQRRLEQHLAALDRLVAEMASDKPQVADAARERFDAIEKVIEP